MQGPSARKTAEARRLVRRGPRRLFEILRYIARNDPDAAERVVSAIEGVGDKLGEFATGHPGRVAGTYEKSVARLPYIVAYALSEQQGTITILHVIHASRDWRSDEWPR